MEFVVRVSRRVIGLPEKRQMAEKGGTSSDISSGSEAAARIRSAESEGPEHAGSVVSEFIEAACTTAESLVEEQKHRFAQRVAGIADALRNAVHPLDRSENRIASRYIEQAANAAENFAHRLRDHRWNELLADTEDFARREPVLFVLGAVATGFLIGRLVGAPTDSRQSENTAAGSPAQTAQTVVAAVSSGSRTAAEASGETTQPPGAAEMR